MKSASADGCDKCACPVAERHGRYKRCDAHPFDRKRRVTDPIAVSTALAREAGVKGDRGPLRGPCAHCRVPFRSFTAKAYCSLTCYVSSGARAEICRRNLAHAVATGRAPARSRKSVTCAHCGDEREVTPSRIGRYWNFCNRVCQRAFYNARFDAFIANPESIALPQNFDEFLDRTELHCPVAGCDWVGKSLSFHARLVHGIPVDRFKMMLGFNLSTGLVSKDLASVLSDRNRSFSDEHKEAAMEALRGAPRGEPRIYTSAEGIEHRRKSNALNPRSRPCTDETRAKISATKRLRSGPVPAAACKACGGIFQPKRRRVVCCSRRCTGRLSGIARDAKRRSGHARSK